MNMYNIYIYGSLPDTVTYAIYIYDTRIKDSSRTVDSHPLGQVTYEPGRAAVKQVGKT
jgi:hypothetical protein